MPQEHVRRAVRVFARAGIKANRVVLAEDLPLLAEARHCEAARHVDSVTKKCVYEFSVVLRETSLVYEKREKREKMGLSLVCLCACVLVR